MTTVTGSFTANGGSAAVSLGNKIENIAYAVTGPFDATVALQVRNRAGGAWRTLKSQSRGAPSFAGNDMATGGNVDFRLFAERIPTNKISNGTFADDAGWTAGAGWTIAAGVATRAAGAATPNLSRTVDAPYLIKGATYRVVLDATVTAGSFTITLGGGSASSAVSATDTGIERDVVAGTSDNELVIIAGATFEGDVDNIFLIPVVSYSLADEDAILNERRDPEGNVIQTTRQSGETFANDVAVGGNVTITGNTTITGTTTFTGAVQGVPVAELTAVDPSQKNTFYDDFVGTTLATRWTAITGNDAQAVAAAHVATTANGAVAFTSGDSNPGVTAADAAGIVGARNWAAAQGGLVMEARVKIDTITLVKAFVGFTDTVALEFPLISNGTTGITATADDAVGFLFDTGATTDVWAGAGVKATTPIAAVINGSAPVADTYVTLRIELSAAGTASFYQDGTLIGTAANAVTAATVLAPVLIIMEAAVAGTRKMTVDYVWIQQNR